jgi:phospholipid transport system substrate-binding protein
MFIQTKIITILAFLLIGSVAFSGNVFANDGKKAQDFINKMGDDAVSFLQDASLSDAQKKDKFRSLLKKNFDMATIGRFALGKNWRSASAAQQKEYLGLFENMIVRVYSERFGEYQGEGFDVESFRDTGKKDILVTSYIVPKSGSKVQVDWRVRNKDGAMKVIDVIIEGVSMSLTQRSDFSSVIQRGGGKIDVLLDHLKK